MAGLAGWLGEPSIAFGIGESCQITVATLALDGMLARAGHQISHGAAQALRFWPGVAVVTARTCRRAIHCGPGCRIDHAGVQAMHCSSQWLDPGNSSHPEGVGKVTLIAKNRLGCDGGFKTGRVVADLSCGGLEERKALEPIVMLAQDIQLGVSGRIRGIHPA